MKGKFVIFVLFTIGVAVINPTLGDLNFTGHTYYCPIKLNKYEQYTAYQVEAVNNAILIIQPKGPKEITQIQSEACLKSKKAVDQYMSVFDLIKQKNCSAIYEIDPTEMVTVLDLIELEADMYSMIQDANENPALLGDIIQIREGESWFETAKFMHGYFNGIKIVMAQMCPGIFQIEVENCHDLLRTAMREAICKSESNLDHIFYSIMDVCKSSSSQKNCSLIHSYYKEAYLSNIEMIFTVFSELDDMLSDIQNENNQ